MALQAEVSRYAVDMQHQEARALALGSQLEAKTTELGELRSSPVASSQPATVDLSEIQRCREEIADLTAKLRAAETHQSATSSAQGDSSADALAANRKIRQMERELAGLKRDKAALEEDLEQNDQRLALKEQEILALRRNVPLPASRPGTPVAAVPSVAQVELETLLAKLQDANRQLHKDIAQRDATIASLQVVQAELRDALASAEREGRAAVEKAKVSNTKR